MEEDSIAPCRCYYINHIRMFRKIIWVNSALLRCYTNLLKKLISIGRLTHGSFEIGLSHVKLLGFRSHDSVISKGDHNFITIYGVYWTIGVIKLYHCIRDRHIWHV